MVNPTRLDSHKELTEEEYATELLRIALRAALQLCARILDKHDHSKEQVKFAQLTVDYLNAYADCLDRLEGTPKKGKSRPTHDILKLYKETVNRYATGQAKELNFDEETISFDTEVVNGKVIIEGEESSDQSTVKSSVKSSDRTKQPAKNLSLSSDKPRVNKAKPVRKDNSTRARQTRKPRKQSLPN